MPNVTAYQKADRLALLEAIDSFFALLGELPTNEEATKLAFTIRRCEYKGEPADVKNLMSLLGWTKGKVLLHLREVQECFEFRTVKDPLDNRRSVQRLYGAENPATTAFFDKCLAVVDRLVEAREEAKKLHPESDQFIGPKTDLICPQADHPLPAHRKPKPLIAPRFAAMAKRAAAIGAAVWLAAWAVFDTDKAEDFQEWADAIWDVIESPAEQFMHNGDHRARDTTVRFAKLETGIGPHMVSYRTVRPGKIWLGGKGRGPHI